MIQLIIVIKSLKKKFSITKIINTLKFLRYHWIYYSYDKKSTDQYLYYLILPFRQYNKFYSSYLSYCTDIFTKSSWFEEYILYIYIYIWFIISMTSAINFFSSRWSKILVIKKTSFETLFLFIDLEFHFASSVRKTDTENKN